MMTASTPRRSVSLCQSHTGSAPAKVRDGVGGVVVGVDAGKDADADAHGTAAVGAHGRGVVSETGARDEAVGLTLRRR